MLQPRAVHSEKDVVIQDTRLQVKAFPVNAQRPQSRSLRGDPPVYGKKRAV